MASYQVIKFYLVFLLVRNYQNFKLIIILGSNPQINWQNGQPTGTKWATACDFKGNDLTNKEVDGPHCAQTCASTFGCTHFTWTNYKSFTCWMKKGSISQSNAVYTGDQLILCGIIPSILEFYLIYLD